MYFDVGGCRKGWWLARAGTDGAFVAAFGSRALVRLAMGAN